MQCKTKILAFFFSLNMAKLSFKLNLMHTSGSRLFQYTLPIDCTFSSHVKALTAVFFLVCFILMFTVKCKPAWEWSLSHWWKEDAAHRIHRRDFLHIKKKAKKEKAYLESSFPHRYRHISGGVVSLDTADQHTAEWRLIVGCTKTGWHVSSMLQRTDFYKDLNHFNRFLFLV